MQRYYRNKNRYTQWFFLCAFVILFMVVGTRSLSRDRLLYYVLSNAIPGLETISRDNIKDMASLSRGFDENPRSKGEKKFFGPLNFMGFGFSGFSQTSGDGASLSSRGKGSVFPLDIRDFSDVPEGEIYFSEEDEYKAEEKLRSYIEEVNAAVQGPKAPVKEDFLAKASDPNKISLTKKTPEILIYHSHATESYMPCTEGNYHTLNDRYNVISVGKIMTKVLQDKYKYKVVHDKTYHDKDSYAYSYTNSLATIKQQTAKNKSIKVILDIHRDAFTIKDDEHRKLKKNEYTTAINGKNAARVMLVISEANPNYKELEKFAAYIKKKMDKLYPGLYLRTDKKTRSKYNLYFSDYSCLIEVGCMLNTIDEANYTAELLGDVLGEVLKDLQK